MDQHPGGNRSNRDLPRANWTTALTKKYASLLIEQIVQGNRSNNVFNRKAWNYVLDEFNKHTGYTFDRKQLKNRHDVMKKQYIAIKSLLNHSDFRWDESRQMVIATDEAWAKYIKAHPEAEKIRVNGCPFFQHLRRLFSESGGDDQDSLYGLQPATEQMGGPESQPQMEQDQSRAKWTDSLNKIYADLMVEQTLQGNRLNSSFNKKAWKYIHDEFNRQTGLNYNSKQLKNHHNVLRRLYVVMKSLLDQNGFSWDKTECMVIAEDELWEKYIAAHPEAEPIRSRGCSIYKMLCRIFSEPGADVESTSSDLETVMHQRDNLLPRQDHSEQDLSSAIWTASLDKMFTDLVIVEKVGKLNNIYDQRTWKYICDELNKQAGTGFDEQQLKDRYNVLRKRYFSLMLLLRQKGFIWDELHGSITAKDEMWDKYLKDHPQAETFRINGCPIYRQLCTLFSAPLNEGYHEGLEQEMDGAEATWSSECPEPANMSLNPLTPSPCLRDEASSRAGEYANILYRQNKRPLGTPSSMDRHKKSCKRTENITNLGGMTSTSRSRTNTLDQCGDQFSISNCVAVLNDIQGVDADLYLAALDAFEDPNRRETFMSIRSDIRLAWLKAKCNIRL